MIEEGFIPLNTKQDYYLAMQLYPRERYLQLFTDLLATRMMWIQEKLLEEGEAGITDATHKVVTIPLTGGGTQRYQYLYAEDFHAHMFKLGFTVDELTSIING